MINKFDPNNSFCVHVYGKLTLHGSKNSIFKGPIKKGLRWLMWGNSSKIATSISFINNIDIAINEVKFAEIIIFTPQSIDKKIVTGEKYHLGILDTHIAEFEILKIVGIWEGKIP